MELLTIGEVARRANLRPSAIRYYESMALLPVPGRTNGQRRYEPEVLDHLAFIRVAQQAGFTVAEVRALVHDDAPATGLSQRWRALAERKLADIEALIARAQGMKQLLDEGLRCGCLTLNDCALMVREIQSAKGVPVATEGQAQ